MSSVELVHGARPSAALLHPLRRRILQSLTEPDSASGVARRLGLPRQNVNYHLRELESHGLLEFVEEKRRGNCVERLVRATSRVYVINPETLGVPDADPAALRDRFSSSYLVTTMASAIRDIGALRQKADAAGKRLGTFTLEGEVRLPSAARRKEFMEELTAEVARLTVKYHDDVTPDGRRFRFILTGYPSPEKEELA